jgi:hypothetical protein
METSRAANGCLAQAVYDERVASRMRRFGAVDRLSNILLDANCPFGEIAWRIAVTLSALSEMEFVDTSDETKNEQHGAQVVSEDVKWVAEKGPWTPRETLVVKKCFDYILKHQADSPAEKQFWGNASQVAKEWLTKHKADVDKANTSSSSSTSSSKPSSSS